MSSCLFALAVLFIGQVNAGNTHYDQYGASGQSAPPPAIDSADEATGGGLVDILEAPPQQSDGQGPASQSSRNAADPYGTTGAPLRGENQRNLQPSTSNTTLQPKTTAPPPGYEMQTQPAPTVACGPITELRTSAVG